MAVFYNIPVTDIAKQLSIFYMNILIYVYVSVKLGHTGLVCKFWRFSILCIICVLCYQDPVLTLNVMQVLAVFYFVYYLCFRLSRPSFDVKCFIALWLFPNQCFSL